MKRTSFGSWPCSIARTVDLIGDWWTPLVLREMFMGARRFEEIQEALSIGRNVLTMRLRRLVADGLLTRRKYQDRPERFEYLITEKAAELFPVLLAMLRWGDKWLDGGKGPPLLLRHKGCGQITHVESVCQHCREELRLESVLAEPGPGMSAASSKRLGARLKAYGARGEPAHEDDRRSRRTSRSSRPDPPPSRT
jgi:DNA-binding HxlR family transcriptional regulator